MGSDEQFKEKLKFHYKDIFGSVSESLVYDGIIDKDLYLQAKHKILWILKEPYGDGAFSYSEYINDFEFRKPYPTSGSMWAKITYANFGILNNFPSWNEMDDIDKNESVFASLKYCALINLKKIPGGTTSYYNEINEAYNKSKEIVLEQFSEINPEIIICGGTFNFIKDDFGLMTPFGLRENFGFMLNDKLVVNANHPSHRISHQTYCDEIINLCHEFVKVSKR